MAGAGYKLFATGDVLTAAQVNTYLMQQTVMVFASSAARTTALSGVLAEGMVSYLQDSNTLEVYDGSAWVGATGDITGLTAGTGISISSATGPVPTVAIDTAVTADLTTGQTLTNKTLTSPVLTTPSISNINAKGDILVGTADNTLGVITAGANGETLVADSSTATGLKWQADTVNTVIDAKGDLLAGTADNTLTRLAVGTNNQVLTADSSTATGLKWATPAGGGGVLGSLTITNGADYTTTSTSLVAVSTSNARVTVTTTSTKLIVLLTGWAENATGNSAWSVSVGAGTVYEQVVSNNSYETPNPNASSMHIITGLTANTSYNVDWMYRAISAGTAIIAGGNNTVYPRMVVLAG